MKTTKVSRKIGKILIAANAAEDVTILGEILSGIMQQWMAESFQEGTACTDPDERIVWFKEGALWAELSANIEAINWNEFAVRFDDMV